MLARIGEVPTDLQPGIFRYVWNGDRITQISPTPIPAALLDQLTPIAEGLEPRERIRLQLPAPTPPPVSLDPRRVAEQFSRNSRGVETMLSWLAEGGFTENLTTIVNSIIADDAGIRPLLESLLFVGSTMAHVAASTLIRTPQELIASLVNLYATNVPVTEKLQPEP